MASNPTASELIAHWPFLFLRHFSPKIKRPTNQKRKYRIASPILWALDQFQNQNFFGRPTKNYGAGGSPDNISNRHAEERLRHLFRNWHVPPVLPAGLATRKPNFAIRGDLRASLRQIYPYAR